MEIHYDIVETDQRAASAYRRARLGRLSSRGWLYACLQLGTALLLAAAVVNTILFYSDASRTLPWELAWSIALVASGGALILLLVLMNRSRMDRLLVASRHDYPLHLTLSVSGRGLSLRDKHADYSLGWQLIDEIEEYDDYVAVALKDTNCLLIPRDAVGGDEDVTDFIHIVQHKMQSG
jgi:hypothetical protein